MRDIQRKWIKKTVKPNIYAVCHLKQAIKRHNGKQEVWIRGDPERYTEACRQFQKRLSKALWPSRYRQSKKLIPLAVTLEGEDWRYHLNFHVRKPDWKTAEEFDALFRNVWSSIDWAVTDVYLDKHLGKATAYSLKEGSETLLIL